MSEPKRYKLRPIFWDYTQKKSVSKDQIDAMGNESAYSHADGDWVKWDDYARLKAEVESVRKYWKATGEGVNRYVGKSIALEDEVTRLKAEVEVWKDMVAENGVACNERARENQDLENQIERLKAEVERLTAFTTRTIVPSEELEADVKALRAELADAQESNHILNETIARLMKGAKR